MEVQVTCEGAVRDEGAKDGEVVGEAVALETVSLAVAPTTVGVLHHSTCQGVEVEISKITEETVEEEEVRKCCYKLIHHKSVRLVLINVYIIKSGREIMQVNATKPKNNI